MYDRKFVEEHCQKPLGHGFEETSFLPRCDLYHSLGDSGIIDGVGYIVRQSGRPQVALQFKIKSQWLRLGPFFRCHSATPSEFQPFDDDVIHHAGIVEDQVLHCQATRADGLTERKQGIYEKYRLVSNRCSALSMSRMMLWQ